MATISATSIRKMAMEKVPREADAQARKIRLVCGSDASV